MRFLFSHWLNLTYRKFIHKQSRPFVADLFQYTVMFVNAYHKNGTGDLTRFCRNCNLHFALLALPYPHLQTKIHPFQQMVIVLFTKTG